MEGYGDAAAAREPRLAEPRHARPVGPADARHRHDLRPEQIAMRLDMAEQAAAITRAGGFENVSTFNETPIRAR